MNARNAFQWHFNAKITTSNHDRIGKLDDLIETRHSLRLFNLRHQADLATRNLACFDQIFRTLNERQGNPVDFFLQNRVEILVIFLCQSTDTQSGVRKAHALAIRNACASDNLAADRLAVRGFGNQFQLAVVDQQTMTGLHSFQNFRVRKIHAGFVARLFIVVECESLACNERNLGILELANAQLRTLKVSQNSDRTAKFLFYITNALNKRTHRVMIGMTHVDTEDVCTGFKKLTDDGFLAGRRAECGENLDLAVALH